MAKEKSKLKALKGNVSSSETATGNIRDISQVRQVPYWRSESEFTLTGDEFLKLQNFMSLFAEPLQVLNALFARSVNDGTINVKYVDNNNNEFSKEEVTNYIASKSNNEHVSEPVLNS